MENLKLDFLNYLKEYKDRTVDDNLKYLFEIYFKYKLVNDSTINDVIYYTFKFMNINIGIDNLNLINQVDKEVIVTSLYNLKYNNYLAVKGPISNYITILEDDSLDNNTKLELLKKYIELLEILNTNMKTEISIKR